MHCRSGTLDRFCCLSSDCIRADVANAADVLGEPALGVAFASLPGSTIAASTDNRGGVCLSDATTQGAHAAVKRLNVFRDAGASCCAWDTAGSANQQALACGSYKGHIRVIDPEAGACVWSWGSTGTPGHEGFVRTLQYRPSTDRGALLLSAGGRTVAIHDTRTVGVPVLQIAASHYTGYGNQRGRSHKALQSGSGTPGLTAAAWVGQQGTPYLVSAGKDGTVCAWDIRMGSTTRRSASSPASTCVSSPRGSTGQSSGQGGGGAKGNALDTPLCTLAVHESGKVAVINTGDADTPRTPIHALQACAGDVWVSTPNTVCCLPLAWILAGGGGTQGEDGQDSSYAIQQDTPSVPLALHTRCSHVLRKPIPAASHGCGRALAVSPCGTLIAADTLVRGKGAALLWHLPRRGRETNDSILPSYVMEGHRSVVNSISFGGGIRAYDEVGGPTQQCRMATACDDGMVRLWAPLSPQLASRALSYDDGIPCPSSSVFSSSPFLTYSGPREREADDEEEGLVHAGAGEDCTGNDFSTWASIAAAEAHRHSRALQRAETVLPLCSPGTLPLHPYQLVTPAWRRVSGHVLADVSNSAVAGVEDGEEDNTLLNLAMEEAVQRHCPLSTQPMMRHLLGIVRDGGQEAAPWLHVEHSMGGQAGQQKYRLHWSMPWDMWSAVHGRAGSPSQHIAACRESAPIGLDTRAGSSPVPCDSEHTSSILPERIGVHPITAQANAAPRTGCRDTQLQRASDAPSPLPLQHLPQKRRLFT